MIYPAQKTHTPFIFLYNRFENENYNEKVFEIRLGGRAFEIYKRLPPVEGASTTMILQIFDC